MVVSLRYWLIDVPAQITEAVGVWYRLYWLIVACLCALVAPAMVLSVLVLWFGFGIRWGW